MKHHYKVISTMLLHIPFFWLPIFLHYQNDFECPFLLLHFIRGPYAIELIFIDFIIVSIESKFFSKVSG